MRLKLISCEVLYREMCFAIARSPHQVEADAELIGVGDSAASLVGPAIYRDFVWSFERKLVDGLHAAGARVRLHICGSTRRILEDMAGRGATL